MRIAAVDMKVQSGGRRAGALKYHGVARDGLHIEVALVSPPGYRVVWFGRFLRRRDDRRRWLLWFGRRLRRTVRFGFRRRGDGCGFRGGRRRIHRFRYQNPKLLQRQVTRR